ncbi:MAG: TetR/AcrR family transcriptional regulator [Vagococcus sp.]
MKKKYTTEEAKKMILDTATALFIEKGYEQTSISDIVLGLDGLTKGAIYHHFESKYHILLEIAKKFVPNDTILTSIDDNEQMTGLNKIQTLLIETMFNQDIIEKTTNSLDLLKDPIFTSIYNKQIAYYLSPKIEQYIKEGIKDGSINTIQPEQMAEVVILLTSTWFIQSLFITTPDNFLKKLSASQFVLKSSGIDVLSEETFQIIEKKLLP